MEKAEPTGAKKHVTARIDVDLLESVKSFASRSGMPVSVAMELLIREGLAAVEGADAVDAALGRRIDGLLAELDSRLSKLSAAADARAEKSASAAAKSLDRAARDINTVRKNAGTAAQASLAGFMMQTWFMPSILKSTAADLHDRFLWPGKAGAIFDVSRGEDGSIILNDKLLPSDFYK